LHLEVVESAGVSGLVNHADHRKYSL